MKSVEGATIEPYQDPLLYEDITDPKQAYWDAAKRGMFNVVNSGAGTGRKAFIGTNYHVEMCIRDRLLYAPIRS